MYRLIWVFAGHTSHIAGFVMRWVNYCMLYCIAVLIVVVHCLKYMWTYPGSATTRKHSLSVAPTEGEMRIKQTQNKWHMTLNVGKESLYNMRTAMVKMSVYMCIVLSGHSLFIDIYYNIWIKHVFSCFNIRQVPWEVLKTEAEGRGFQHLPRDPANVNALKKHVRSLLLHKTENICCISCTILFRLFPDVARTLFPRTMLVLGQGSIHLVTAAILWPRYERIESCVAVH